MLLLAVALAGTLYARTLPRRDECARPERFLDAAAFDPPLSLHTEGARGTNLEKGRLIAIWPGTPDQPGDIAVAIVRTQGLPNLLLEPAMALPGRNEPDDVQTGFLETSAGRIPVDYGYERRGREVRITAYLMAHRREATTAPFWTRVREGPSALAGGSWPITLFVAAAHAHVSRIDDRRERLDAWLRDAWVHYREVCTAD